jgi:hypothetical protein
MILFLVEGCFILVCEILAIFVSSVFNVDHLVPMCLIFLSVNSERKWKRSHSSATTFLLLLTGYFDVVLKTKSYQL